MKKSIIMFLLLIFCISLNLNAQNKIAVTIDDMPMQRLGEYKQRSDYDIFIKLVKAIQKEKTPVTGFVNEGKMMYNGKPVGTYLDMLEEWLKAGIDIGNHTYSHVSLHKTTAKNYEEDILKGEKVIKPLTAKYGKKLKYFRHPFLQTGLSLEVRDEINKFLAEHGYTVAPVSMDNTEWVFGKAYDMADAAGDKPMMKKIGSEYIKYMKSSAEYWEQQSTALFGRNISHILLIHSNKLNSDYYSELIGMFRSINYEIVSLDKALEDPAYKTEERFIRNAGISWIHRWAITQGKTKEFFGHEPEFPKFVADYAGVTEY